MLGQRFDDRYAEAERNKSYSTQRYYPLLRWFFHWVRRLPTRRHSRFPSVGICIGNRNSRILASEIVEYKDDRREFKESVNRIVEFGVAHHCAAIAVFLSQVGAKDFIVSSGQVEVPNL